MRLMIACLCVVGIFGCSSEVQMKGAPVSVSGKVSQGGQPCGGMVMVFHPLGDGHIRELAVQKDGTFSGELISGDYAYYVAKPMVATAATTVKKVAPQYFEADLGRTVTVAPGQQLAIALD
jgi:hypothetical protein